ncbi:unnamed protein product, partial [Symbiodinium sp. KB8]
VNLIIANEITPHLTADEYLDRGEYENELKQVIGDTRAAFDITQYDTLIFGDHGLLLAGPNSRTYEPLLCSYLQLTSMDLFVRNFYSRMAVVLDFIRDVRPSIVQMAWLGLTPLMNVLVMCLYLCLMSMTDPSPSSGSPPQPLAPP